MKLHRYVDHQRLHIVTKDVISLSISVLLLFRHYISHKITFGAPSSGGVLCSACGAFIIFHMDWYGVGEIEFSHMGINSGKPDFLAQQIRLSEILAWVRNVYLTCVILPKLSCVACSLVV